MQDHAGTASSERLHNAISNAFVTARETEILPLHPSYYYGVSTYETTDSRRLEFLLHKGRLHTKRTPLRFTKLLHKKDRCLGNSGSKTAVQSSPNR